MKPIVQILDERISQILQEVTGMSGLSALVRPATDPKFGDYQANGVMAAAKQMKQNPRKLAEEVVSRLDLSDICEEPEVAGPGFINLRVSEFFLAEQVMKMYTDPERLGVEITADRRRFVVDFSGPNIAKQMHVGHLRSTILGDCLSRVLGFVGHEVIRQNHIGDWGTQFGMLIAYLRQTRPEVLESPDSVEIADLEQFYKDAKAKCDSDADFAAAARQEVVNLHNHQPETVKIWQHIVDESRKHYQPIYDQLGVNLHQENERGESFYADRLRGVVEELQAKGLAETSDGAVCVFPQGFTGKEGDPLPFIIQKSDGAFLYATTDLAALKYRFKELKADSVIYVTDARQKMHFAMLFATVRLAEWVDEYVELSHVTFGTVLGEDGKPFKTRSGESVKLQDLLDESVQRARKVVEEKNPALPGEKKDRIAAAVGIGAIKYADYSNNRDSDYMFSFDRMLAMEGNTAPYMQYAYARVKSIERKAQEKGIDMLLEAAEVGRIELDTPEERELAKHLVRYGEAIDLVLADYRPNFLTSYLYDLSQRFSAFYNACPVLAAEGDTRRVRLLLCDLTARVIRHGMQEMLGIDVVEQM